MPRPSKKQQVLVFLFTTLVVLSGCGQFNSFQKALGGKTIGKTNSAGHKRKDQKDNKSISLKPFEILGNCSKLNPSGNKSVERSHCNKPWTVLIYMQADNDLARYALEDLYEIESGFKSGQFAASTNRMDVVVELDMPGDTGIERLHMQQQKHSYNINDIIAGQFDDYKNARQKILSPVVEKLDEEYLTKLDDRLENFLKWGIQQYPSEKYIVILWSHGLGWGTRSFEGGILLDESPKREIVGIPDLKSILEEVRRFSNNERQFDLLVFDACFMQTVEVIAELRDEARFILGSSESQEYQGLPYRRWFYSLNKNSRLDVDIMRLESRCGSDKSCQTSYILTELVKSTWKNRGFQNQLNPEGKQTYTYSAFESSFFSESVLPVFQSLSFNLNQFLKGGGGFPEKLTLYRSMSDIPHYDSGNIEISHWIVNLEKSLEYYEKSDEGISDTSDLRISLKELQSALQYSNVNYAFGRQFSEDPKYPLTGAMRAISIWLPSQEEDFKSRIEELSKSRFFLETGGWSDWINNVYEPIQLENRTVLRMSELKSDEAE